ncbi:D-amino acid dehydrogenase [Gayadomonas joobiniege]|uniref:D-amino acid dehydrogenase n=1 Tax=Gayadomonas joobiniege TaxID=1234606 RepID=UPI000378C8E7|nr:D-amino acid dehydrogenase [Gayadomonas joobiniege]
MQILVIGAGVIGVTSAWYLNQSGHQVTVIDSHQAPAMQTSFANAAMLSATMAAPWSAPGIPIKALHWLLQTNGPFKITSQAMRSRYFSWLLQFLNHCRQSKYLLNKQKLVKLGLLSLSELQALKTQLNIDYSDRHLGTLQLYSSRYKAQAMEKDIDLLHSLGVSANILSAGQCQQIEPGLSRCTRSFGAGLHYPQDATGNCRLFTQSLAQHAQQAGVKFIFNQSVNKIIEHNHCFKAVQTEQGEISADLCVIAAGCHTVNLLKPLYINLPICPIRGYSITLPLTVPDASNNPQSTILHEDTKIAITRIGNQVRVGGMAELAGYSQEINQKRFQLLEQTFKQLFPFTKVGSAHDHWFGFRPMTPDAIPRISNTKIKNLYLNSGHGSLGWTLAAGSARLLADLINQQPNRLNYQDYAL